MTTRDTPWPDGTPCWTDLGAPDVAKARDVYGDVFSWTVSPGGPETRGYSIAELNGRPVAGVGPKMGQRGEPQSGPQSRRDNTGERLGGPMSAIVTYATHLIG